MRPRATVVAVITVVTLVAIAVLSAVSIQGSYTTNLATEKSKLAATAEVTADLLSEQMVGVEDIEQALVARPSFVAAIGSGNPMRFDATALQPLLNETAALRPEFQLAAVSDGAGVIRAVAPADPAVIGRNFSYRDWYRGVFRTGRPYVSEAYVSAITGRPLVVAVATAIRGPATGDSAAPIVGILFVGYRIGSVQSFTAGLAHLEHISLQVTDQAGTVLTAGGGSLVAAPRSPVLSAALAGHATAGSTSSEISAASPVVGLGWTVTATTSLTATLAASGRTQAALIALGLLIVLGVAGLTLTIVTHRLDRARARQAFSEAEIRTVLGSLTEAIQVFDVKGALLTRNQAASTLYELTDDQQTTDAIAPTWELLREDDSVMGIEDGPLAAAMRTGEFTEQVVGLRRRSDGSVRWLSVNTVPIRGTGGILTGYVSCATNITDRAETIRALRILTTAGQRLNASLVPGQVVTALSAAATELGSAPGEAPRRAGVLLVQGDRLEVAGANDVESPSAAQSADFLLADHPHASAVIATGEALVTAFDLEDFGPSARAIIAGLGLRNGALVPMFRGTEVFGILVVSGRQEARVSAAALGYLKALAVIGALAFTNAEAHQVAADLARTDPLTGIANRRALDDRLAQLRRSRFALVAIDVDSLKAVNDAHGHDAGDEMLCAVAVAMARELRPADLLARTGGDEFTAVLPDCDARAAIELGRRLQRAVGAITLPWGSPSVSMGSAFGPAGVDPTVTAKAADRALYAAKQARADERKPAASGVA